MRDPNEEFNTEFKYTYIIEEFGEVKNYIPLGMSYDNEDFEIIGLDLTEGYVIVLLQFTIKIGTYLKLMY